MTSLAVIITTYNRPDALRAVLTAYLSQKDLDFEMIIADDGSTEETAQLVVEMQARADFRITHIWHEDLGFRAAAIRNRALAATTADYVLFSDGDCIPLPGFVARHRRLAERGWFLAGNRILMSDAATGTILGQGVPIWNWGYRRWVSAAMTGQINRLLPLLPLPFASPLRKLPAKRWEGVMTCNLSAWRSDLLMVNGFDEDYCGWGLEDSDLTIRLLHAGVRRKSARFAAPVLHLWHKENDRGSLSDNQQRLEELLRSDGTTVKRGVGQYLT
jgi:glycosyltransferase involved in cell wall biosynthesis